MRGTAAAATSERRTGVDAAPEPPAGARGASRSSVSVFHPPHSGQRPSHCGLWAPQAEQEKTVAGFRATYFGIGIEPMSPLRSSSFQRMPPPMKSERRPGFRASSTPLVA